MIDIPTEDDFNAIPDSKLLEAFHRVIVEGCKCDFKGSLDGDCYHSGDCCDLREAYEQINKYSDGAN
jgi:hypothetical protein